MVAAARLGIGSTYKWPPGVSERTKTFFSRRKTMKYHSNDLCYGSKGSWYIFKSCLAWSFWNSCGFNPVCFCLCYAADGKAVRVSSAAETFPFPQHPVRQVLQLSASEVLLYSWRSRMSSFLCYGWCITPSIIPTFFGRSFLTQPRADSIREATFPPGSGASHRLVPGVCVFPPSPDTWDSLGSRQLGSLPGLSSAAAPLSTATRIQLWSFCCQPCWLQQ